MITNILELSNDNNISDTILMNILEDNYDLNLQFHKEVREMIYSFSVAHYVEKLTLSEWLNKYYYGR